MLLTTTSSGPHASAAAKATPPSVSVPWPSSPVPNSGTRLRCCRCLRHPHAKIRVPLDPAKAFEIVAEYRAFPPRRRRLRAVGTSRRSLVRYQISYWDGAIGRGCRELNAEVLYSEDLSPGQSFGTVRVCQSIRQRVTWLARRECRRSRRGATAHRAAVEAVAVARGAGGGELATTLALRPLLRRLPRGDGHPAPLLPGFLASDFSTRPLRRFLRDLGYWAHRWNLGANSPAHPRRPRSPHGAPPRSSAGNDTAAR